MSPKSIFSTMVIMTLLIISSVSSISAVAVYSIIPTLPSVVNGAPSPVTFKLQWTDNFTCADAFYTLSWSGCASPPAAPGTCTPSATYSGQVASYFEYSYSCSPLMTNPSSASDPCNLILTTGCFANGGVGDKTGQLTSVLAGAITVTDRTLSPDKLVMPVGTSPTLTLAGSNFPTAGLEWSQNVVMNLKWERSAGVSCAGGPADWSLSSATTLQAFISLTANNVSSARDGCVLSIKGISRRGLPGFIVSGKESPFAIAIQAMPTFNIGSNNAGVYIANPTVYSTATLSLPGTSLPVSGEPVFVTYSLQDGVLQGHNGFGSDCISPQLSPAGDRVNCTIQIGSLSKDPATLSVTLARQNFSSVTTSTTLYLISVKPDVPVDYVIPTVVYNEQFTIRVTVPANFNDPFGSLQFVQESCLTMYTIGCAENRTGCPGCFACTATVVGTPGECMLSGYVRRLGVRGASADFARLLTSKPVISGLVSAQLWFTANDASNASLIVQGSNLMSTAAPFTDEPVVQLVGPTSAPISNQVSYPCYTEPEAAAPPDPGSPSPSRYRCRTHIPRENDESMFSVVLSRYNMVANSSSLPTVTVKWPAKITVTSPVRLAPNATGITLTVSGVAFCTANPLIIYRTAATTYPVGAVCKDAGTVVAGTLVSINPTSFAYYLTNNVTDDYNCVIEASQACDSLEAVPAVVAAVSPSGLLLVEPDTPTIVLESTFLQNISVSGIDLQYYAGMNLYVSVGAGQFNASVFAPTDGGTRMVTFTANINANIGTLASGDADIMVWVKCTSCGGQSSIESNHIKWGTAVPIPTISTIPSSIAVDSATNSVSLTYTVTNLPNVPFDSSTTGALSWSNNGVAGLVCPSSVPSSLTFPISGSSRSVTVPIIVSTDADRCFLNMTVYRYNVAANSGVAPQVFFKPVLDASTAGVSLAVADATSSQLTIPMRGNFFDKTTSTAIQGVAIQYDTTSAACTNMPAVTTAPTFTEPFLNTSSGFWELTVTVRYQVNVAGTTAGDVDGCRVMAVWTRAFSLDSSITSVGTVVTVPYQTAVASTTLLNGVVSLVNITGQMLGSNSAVAQSSLEAESVTCGALQSWTNANPNFLGNQQRYSANRKWQAIYVKTDPSTASGACMVRVHLRKSGLIVASWDVQLQQRPPVDTSASRDIVFNFGGTAVDPANIAATFRDMMGLTNADVRATNTAKRAAMQTVTITFAMGDGLLAYDTIQSTPDIMQSFENTLPSGAFVQSIAFPQPAPIANTADAPIAAPTSSGSAPQSVAPLDGNNNAGGGGGSVAGIAAGVVIGVVVIIAIIIIVIVVRRRKQNGKSDGGSGKKTEPANSTEMAEKTANSPEDRSNYGAIASVDNGKASATTYQVMDNKADDPDESQDEPDQIDSLTGMMQKEFDAKWYIPFENIKFLKVLGRGAYGQVHKAKWNGVVVAVKQTMALQIDHNAIEEFKHEAKLLLNLQPHPNVVQVFGISIHNGSLFLIMEFCSMGSMDKFIEKNKLSVPKKTAILAECARGIAHLHGSGIVHRDIAMRNILVGKGGVPKISDFGMSRTIVNQAAEGKTASTVGPLKWMAPESLARRAYSPKSDVYTFGVLVSEVFTEHEPFPDLELLAAAMAIRDNGLTPDLGSECPANVAAIAQECWNRDVDARPDMKSVAERLTDIADELASSSEGEESQEEAQE